LLFRSLYLELRLVQTRLVYMANVNLVICSMVHQSVALRPDSPSKSTDIVLRTLRISTATFCPNCGRPIESALLYQFVRTIAELVSQPRARAEYPAPPSTFEGSMAQWHEIDMEQQFSIRQVTFSDNSAMSLQKVTLSGYRTGRVALSIKWNSADNEIFRNYLAAAGFQTKAEASNDPRPFHLFSDHEQTKRIYAVLLAHNTFKISEEDRTLMNTLIEAGVWTTITPPPSDL